MLHQRLLTLVPLLCDHVLANEQAVPHLLLQRIAHFQVKGIQLGEKLGVLQGQVG